MLHRRLRERHQQTDSTDSIRGAFYSPIRPEGGYLPRVIRKVRILGVLSRSGWNKSITLTNWSISNLSLSLDRINRNIFGNPLLWDGFSTDWSCTSSGLLTCRVSFLGVPFPAIPWAKHQLLPERLDISSLIDTERQLDMAIIFHISARVLQ